MMIRGGDATLGSRSPGLPGSRPWRAGSPDSPRAAASELSLSVPRRNRPRNDGRSSPSRMDSPRPRLGLSFFRTHTRSTSLALRWHLTREAQRLTRSSSP
jgi:hypothetical protein